MALIALAASARVFMTQEQALASAFPPPAKVARQQVFLTKAQGDAARRESGVEFTDALVVRYVATREGRVAGYAYFDTHRVRTLAETVMVVLDAEGKIRTIEILSFDEPPDYMARERWLDQFNGRRLNDDLSLKRAIRPMSGASLTGRAIVNASRKVLALHRVIGPSPPG